MRCTHLSISSFLHPASQVFSTQMHHRKARIVYPAGEVVIQLVGGLVACKSCVNLLACYCAPLG
jgi:hypothetical protein